MESSDLFYRQIHRTHLTFGEVTSAAFIPSSRDNGERSGYDGSLISAMDSYTHYTEFLGLESEGAWGVSVRECSQLSLNILPRPLANSAAHCIIDFRGLPKSEIRTKAKELSLRAGARGRQAP